MVSKAQLLFSLVFISNFLPLLAAIQCQVINYLMEKELHFSVDLMDPLLVFPLFQALLMGQFLQLHFLILLLLVFSLLLVQLSVGL